MPFEAYFPGRLVGGHRLDAIEDALVQLHGGSVAQVKNQGDARGDVHPTELIHTPLV